MSTNQITPDQLVRAVLSLDAYHRGYNSPGLVTGTGVYDFTLGEASGGKLFGDQRKTDQAIGFFAQEYVDSSGKKIVAYRGTDDNFGTGPTSDMRNGFGIGAGKPDGPQGQAAIEFYREIAGENADLFEAEIELTGQSLGGGLAGYVASLYDKDATIFSHMNFLDAAKHAFLLAQGPSLLGTVGSAILTAQDIAIVGLRQAFQVPVTLGLLDRNRIDSDALLGKGAFDTTATQIEEMRQRIWGPNGTPVSPDAEGIHSFYLSGEFLSRSRLAATLNLSPIAETAWDPFNDGNQISGTPDAFARHSQAPLVIIAYGNLSTDGPPSDEWQRVFPQIWLALYNENVGEALGFEGLPEESGNGLLQAWTAHDLMRAAIAYSVVDSGQRPFGDTGIRALYDDAIDLGKFSNLNVHPFFSEDAQEAWAAIAAQFAGDLAFAEVLQSEAAGAAQGIFSRTEDDRALVGDLDPEKWQSTFEKGNKQGMILDRAAAARKRSSALSNSSRDCRRRMHRHRVFWVPSSATVVSLPAILTATIGIWWH